MVILGINPGIDATAALLVDGKIAAIVEEERLSRKKMHLGFPRRAIQEVLRLAHVDPKRVDAVTFSFIEYLDAHPVITRMLLGDQGCPFDPENPLVPSKILRSVSGNVVMDDLFPLSFRRSHAANRRRNERLYLDALRQLGIDVPTIQAVEHHTAHAASAYYTSGFDECLVVTADGAGDGLSLTVSIGQPTGLKRIQQTHRDSSAGIFYGSVTAFLGFKAHRHEGKITGLAAFGDPETCNEAFVPCLRIGDDGSSLANDFATQPLSQRLAELGRLPGGRYFRNPVMNAYLTYYEKTIASASREDVAAAAQYRLEKVFCDYLKPILKKTGLKKLALAGGVFSNVKLNQRLFELDAVEEIFIHPNMGDGGNALGSALLAHVENGRARGVGVRVERLSDVYFGPSFTNKEIESELERSGFQYRLVENIEPEIAHLVAGGSVVGRFNGPMEYGPRALGNRSILADPREAGINKILNDRLHRTEFMPFAPSVLNEDSTTYFDLAPGAWRAAEYMTITCDVKPAWCDRIAAVSHVDGTARPQLVKQEVNPSFHAILSHFKRQTGLGTLVNTSFNIHEEPIICTPADACRAFKLNAVDALAIGNFLVERNGQPTRSEHAAHSA
ncbi:MAG TPA: carbamoyltransferase C-terminal domain-containing protein [Vicinamibacterales bacterium]